MWGAPGGFTTETRNTRRLHGIGGYCGASVAPLPWILPHRDQEKNAPIMPSVPPPCIPCFVVNLLRLGEPKVSSGQGFLSTREAVNG
jgi:hypothetical protein